MATPSHIRDQAYQFFLEEAPELLHTIESGLLLLRSQRDTAEIHQIMRAAHSLKGGAASVGLEPIQALAHRLEALFKALYSDTVVLDDELESQLLQAFDCLRLPLTQQLTEGFFDGDRALLEAEPVLQALETQLASALAETENFLPSSSDLGFDMVTAILEVDVQQGLDHLAGVLAQPESCEVAGELRAQAEIFMGFAELLDLPGFASIAETALQALATHPDQALHITGLAIADFSQGRAAVLSARSTTGGAPSPALQALATPSATLAATDQNGNLPAMVDALAWLNPAPIPPDPAPATPIAAEAVLPEPVAAPSPVHHDATAAAIEALFSTAAATAAEVIPTPSPTPPRPSSPPPPAAPLTVRVDTQRLARLDNQLGELTINRNGLALQASQIRLSLKDLGNRFERVRSTVEQLQQVSDQILIAPERQRQPMASRAFTAAATPLAPGFDPLEMDTYTALYTYTQTLLEEMVQLEEVAADITLFNRQADQLLGQNRKMLAQMQDDLMSARRVPLGQVLNRFPRVLRDLSNTYGKPAHLTLAGTDLLVDKAILEKLYDPLLHLLRNGFDHGLELPADRVRLGKPEVGQITIGASYRGRQIAIEVSDDGRGLDLERVRQRLVELAWLSPEEADAASPDQLSRYIFEPGFSTAEQISELSGRGVGLDVVRDQTQRLKGTVTVRSEPGQGTRFTLSLPMTLSIVNLLICFVGSTPIAFRSDSITEILLPRSDQLSSDLNRTWLSWNDQQIPVYNLGDLLTYRCFRPELPLSQVLAAVPSPADWEAPLLILTRDQRHFAIQVNRLVTEQESVIKPFGTALTTPPYAYGCTVLGDGSVIPVVDGPYFLDEMIRHPDGRDRPGASTELTLRLAPPSRPAILQATTVLVVDDAVTSRRTLALSLERADYRVIQARDGQAALEQLGQNPAVGLIICDIEMPNMNGFEFLTARRQDPALAKIPTLMLTSRSNDKHRWLAIQLGATDYFTKPYNEQTLLKTVEALTQPALVV